MQTQVIKPAIIEPYLDLVHVIYPEDVYVTPDLVLMWAWDALINQAVDDYVKQNGPIADDVEDFVMASLRAAHPRPTDIEEAKEILSDLGTHTFGRL